MFSLTTDKLVEVTKAQHTTNAQRSGYMQVEFKDVITGAKGADRFRSDEEVEGTSLIGWLNRTKLRFKVN